jgi:mono/diheme cytochrome c family protein
MSKKTANNFKRSGVSGGGGLLACYGLGTAAFVVGIGLMNAQAESPNKPSMGEKAYRQQCASCHGVKGEGTKLYRKPLIGDQSAGQLAQFIGKSMPPGPRHATPKDAKLIAAYIHDAFYSPVAQARNLPPRIELSRLTVRQYRNALTDLIGSFRAPVSWSEARGLKAEYFKARDLRGDQRVLERIDPQVDFDFGTKMPVPEQPDPHRFAMRWTGAVLAPETGNYEFVIKSDHAMRLWVNDPKRPLIDATVKSGKDNEYRGVLTLLGGRVYPIRFEFSKAKQGVDDAKKELAAPPLPASVSLQWKPPKRELEVIPSRCLLPVDVPEAFVSTTPFPPDDRSMGYERGNSISKAWDEATTEAAFEATTYIVTHLAELSGAANNAPDRAAKVQEFCKQFVARALRRPLTPEETAFYVGRQFARTPDVEMAVKRVLLLTLKSPQFLYREIGAGKPNAFDVASRLSFGLWDSPPDAELLKAAEEGKLVTREQVATQAERMTQDPRTWFKLREFLLLWLKVDAYPDLAKNAKRYPDFDAAVANDLRTSFELFLEQTAWGNKSDFRELLLTDKFALNGRLAKVYGAKMAADAPFQTVALEPNERAGVLSHPYLLASFAYLDASSPIHRGVLVARNLLGRQLQPPPQAFTPLAADLHPKLTTRQRVILQTKPAACDSCHGMINPLGFAMERFDAIGRIREMENGTPVDASGSYTARNGKKISFGGAKDLARFLANSDETHAAFVEKLFQFLTKQPVRAYGAQTLPNLQRAFVSNGFNIRRTMVEMMATSVLQGAGSRGQETASKRISAR